MTLSRLRPGLALLAFCAAVAAGRAARGDDADGGDKTVVLRDITGPGGPAITAQLTDWLSDNYTFVADPLYRKIAKQTGHTGTRADDVQAVLSQLGADVLIEGSVRGGMLYIMVREGDTGAVATVLSSPVGRRLSPTALQAIESGLTDAIAQAPKNTAARPTVSPPEEAAPVQTPERAPSEEDNAPAAMPESEGGSSGEAPAAAGEAAAIGERVTPAMPELRALAVDAGFDTGYHSISRAGAPGYASTGAGLRVDASFAPFDNGGNDGGNDGWQQHLAVFAELEDDALATGAAGGGGRSTTVSTHEQRWAGGLRGRFTAGSWRVLADVGYGERLVDMPPTALLGQLPSLNYRLLVGRLGFWIPLNDSLAVLASGALLPVLDAGAEPSTRYAGTSAFGGEARGGLELALGSSFYAVADASLAIFSVNLNDASAPQSASALDTRLGLFVTLGYAR